MDEIDVFRIVYLRIPETDRLPAHHSGQGCQMKLRQNFALFERLRHAVNCQPIALGIVAGIIAILLPVDVQGTPFQQPPPQTEPEVPPQSEPKVPAVRSKKTPLREANRKSRILKPTPPMKRSQSIPAVAPIQKDGMPGNAAETGNQRATEFPAARFNTGSTTPLPRKPLSNAAA